MGTDIGTIDVTVVGDVHLVRDDPAGAFVGVEAPFAEADVLIGNLEGTLSAAGEVNPMNKGFALRSPPEMVDGLTAAGFDVVSFANNHSMDFGTPALVETIDLVRAEDISVAGAGRNRAEAERVRTVTADGISVGVVSFEATDATWQNMQATADHPGINVLKVSPYYGSPYLSEDALSKVDRVVSTAVGAVDVLIVMLHAGISIDHTVTPLQRAAAERCVRAGADAVIGHHPHTVQGIDLVAGAPTFYSLGNFVFDDLAVMDRYEKARLSGMARLEIAADGIEAARFSPVWIDDDGNPGLAEPGTDAFTRIVELSRREGIELEPHDDHFVVPLG